MQARWQAGRWEDSVGMVCGSDLQVQRSAQQMWWWAWGLYGSHCLKMDLGSWLFLFHWINRFQSKLLSSQALYYGCVCWEAFVIPLYQLNVSWKLKTATAPPPTKTERNQTTKHAITSPSHLVVLDNDSYWLENRTYCPCCLSGDFPSSIHFKLVMVALPRTFYSENKNSILHLDVNWHKPWQCHNMSLSCKRPALQCGYMICPWSH